MTGKGAESGIALMIVMFGLSVLMVVVLGFSFIVREDMRATTAFREGAEEKYLAEGGIERAAVEIMHRKINAGASAALSGRRDVWSIDGTPSTFSLGNGTCLVRITDESGKVDLNKTSEIIMKGLLLNLGVRDETTDEIVDSIQDWRDPDDLARLHGAESDYYMSLPKPYKAKNADFESVEELLLVKGVTYEILYGSGDRPGLADFVTVYSDSGKINIVAAPLEVLKALPGMTPEIAAAIIDYRQNPDIVASAGIQNIIGTAYAAMSQYVMVGESNTFTVESAGRKNPKRAGYGIKAVISMSGNRFSYRYYRSPWDMSRWREAEQ